MAAGEVYHPDARRAPAAGQGHACASARRAASTATRACSHGTGIRELRRKPVFTTPNAASAAALRAGGRARTTRPRSRRSSRRTATSASRTTRSVHHFYDQLCPACAEFNFGKRTELADLRGRVALLTGGRVKIGYQAGLKLLRAGAHLIVTTRFPRDSAARYAREPDFAEWGHRLEIFGLDLRHTPSVEAFCRVLLATARAARLHHQQRLPDRAPSAGFLRAHDGGRDRGAARRCPSTCAGCSARYEGLRGYHLLPEGGADAAARRRGSSAGAAARSPGLTHAAELSQVPLLPEELAAQKDLFPQGRLDQDLQQVDLREPQLLAAAAGRGAVGGAARGAARQRRRAVHPQRAAQAAHAAHAGARQAHRQRVGGRGAVLPQAQDHAASAHQHGQGRAQHDDAHLGDRLPRTTAST